MVARRWRPLILPGLATLAVLAALLALGFWQLERKGWKEELIARIEARAFGEPEEIPREGGWEAWSRAAEEYRRVRVAGTFLHEHEAPVHGLMSGSRGRPAQGFYILTPLRLGDGSIVIVNRGFVPTDLREPRRREEAQAAGEVVVTGLVRAPETRGWFAPENDPKRDVWFVRDPAAIARGKGLERVAPFLIDADATENPGGWPKGGQTRLAVSNNHLHYALTWFGLALTLVVVFGAFAWRTLRTDRAAPIEDDAWR